MNKFELAEALDLLNKLDEAKLVEEATDDKSLISEVLNDPAMKVFNTLCDGTFEFDPNVDYAHIEDANGPDTAILVGCRATMTLPAVWDGTDDDDSPANADELSLINGDTPIDVLADMIRDTITFPIILANGKKIVDFEIASDYSEEEYSMTDYEVKSLSHEDAGIGSYEYWGMIGDDSKPYTEYTGTITCDITDGIFLCIE